MGIPFSPRSIALAGSFETSGDAELIIPQKLFLVEIGAEYSDVSW
jgi:hypothetical protein